MSLNVTGKFIRNGICGCKDFSTKRISNLSVSERLSRETKGRPETSPKFIQLLYIPRQNFHYQSIIQFHVQATHGILLEALQKSRVSIRDVNDIKIPDELRRLKSGSLKWLFGVWPLPKNPFSGLSGVSESTVMMKPPNDDERNPDKLMLHLKNDEKQLHEMVEFLKREKIAIRRLIKLPWLLSSNPDVVQQAVKRVKSILGIQEFGVAISFVNLNQTKLLNAAAVWKKEIDYLSRKAEEESRKKNVKLEFRNRIDYMSYLMQSPKEDISDIMAKVNQILVMPLECIEKILQVLLDAGVKSDSIISDPWIFVNGLNLMKKRIRIIQENGITEFKPWALRASHSLFEKFVARAVLEMELRGNHKDTRGYLQEKLKCDEKSANSILTRVPSIKTATAIKLNEMIDLLYASGFTAAHIIECPKILGYKPETVAERLKEIAAITSAPVTHLRVLCKTSKTFPTVLKKIRAEQNMSEKRNSIESIEKS